MTGDGAIETRGLEKSFGKVRALLSVRRYKRAVST
jgi:hypothetical protein